MRIPIFKPPWMLPEPYEQAMGLIMQDGCLKGTQEVYAASLRSFLVWAWWNLQGIPEPDKLTISMVTRWVRWLREPTGADLRVYMVGCRNGNHGLVYQAIAEIGPATLMQLWQHVSEELRQDLQEPKALRGTINEMLLLYAYWIAQYPKGNTSSRRNVKYYIKERKPLSVAGFNSLVCSAESAFSRIVRLGLAHANPFADVAGAIRAIATTTPYREVRATHEDIGAMLASCDQTRIQGVRDFVVMAACVFLGVRAKELVAVRREHLVEGPAGSQYLLIEHPRRRRLLYLSPRMQRALARLQGMLLARANRPGPMSVWAEAVLTPNAPLFPAMYRWGAQRSKVAPPDRAMHENMVTVIVRAHRPQASAFGVSDIRAYWREMLLLQKHDAPEQERRYLMGQTKRYPRDVDQAVADQMLLKLEASVTDKTGLSW